MIGIHSQARRENQPRSLKLNYPLLSDSVLGSALGRVLYPGWVSVTNQEFHGDWNNLQGRLYYISFLAHLKTDSTNTRRACDKDKHI